MLDFSRPDKTRSEDIGEAITALLDNAIVAHQKAEYEAGRGSGTGDVAKHRIGAQPGTADIAALISTITQHHCRHH